MENLEHRLRKTRLRWFGHVKLRDENSDGAVEGRRPVGRPKKTWSKIVDDDDDDDGDDFNLIILVKTQSQDLL